MPGKSPWKSIRNGIYAWLMGWVAWVPFSFLWGLCWITVILGPPATFALAQGAQYAVLGVSPSLRDLARYGWSYFWLSWAWMLVNLGVFALLASPFYLEASLPPSLATGLKWITIVLGLLWLAIQFFTLPLIMIADEKNLLAGFRDAVHLMTSAPGYALATAGTGLAIGIFSLILIAPLILGGAGLVAVLGNQAAIDRPKTDK